MIGLHHHFRLPCIALAAIVGVLSVVSEAAAAPSKETTRSCCSRAGCGMPCCEQPADRAAAQPSVALTTIQSGLASLPEMPCQCRSEEPAAPAPKSEPSSSEHRPDQDRASSVDLTIEAPRATAFVRATQPTSCLSRAPLYLRTTRLLI
jgi:hypothetical protein